MKWLERLKEAFGEAQKQKAACKGLPCKIPPHPFDWAHEYEHKTFFHDAENKSGYSASVCSKCGYEHPGSIVYFAKIIVPLESKKSEEI